jgi:predicted nuclease with TOPRIM domain
MGEVPNPIHIQIRQSSVLRKDVLESSLKCIELIQFNERLKELRTEKSELISKFKNIVGSINSLVQCLDFQELPEMGLKEEHVKIKKEVKERTKPKVVIEAPKKSRSKLESEMDEIRAKLDKLEL